MKPFDFGKIADDFYFTNRTKEIGWLKRQVDNRINTMLISPRRWGKSSLVQQVAAKYKNRQVLPCSASWIFLIFAAKKNSMRSCRVR